MQPDANTQPWTFNDSDGSVVTKVVSQPWNLRWTFSGNSIIDWVLKYKQYNHRDVRKIIGLSKTTRSVIIEYSKIENDTVMGNAVIPRAR